MIFSRNVRHQTKMFRLPPLSMKTRFLNASRCFLKVVPAPMMTITQSNMDAAFGRISNRTAAFGRRTSCSIFDEVRCKMDAGVTSRNHFDALWKMLLCQAEYFDQQHSSVQVLTHVDAHRKSSKILFPTISGLAAIS